MTAKVANRWLTAIALMLAASATYGADSARQGAQLSPEKRVTAFIADYERRHEEFHESRRGDQQSDGDAIDADFKQWEAVVGRLDEAHFADGGGRALAGVIHDPAPHDSDSEKIIGTTRAGDRVFVETQSTEASSLTNYFEYELIESGADWRIVRIREYPHPANAPFMTDKERPRFASPKLHELAALRKQESGFNGTAIFAAGAVIEDEGQKSRIEVKRIGLLNVTTGVLVLGDFGYGPYTLSPVGQRVAPGKYPVEISIAFKRVAALRLLLSDNPVVKWHPADMGDGGHGVGVDAGNVSISDVSVILAVKSRDKERAFEKYADAPAGPNARLLSLMNTDDVAIADSGYGDGRYPVYWGVDSAGRLAVLLVDFWVVPQPGRPGANQ
jgi:hypothetical protein